MLRNLYDLDQIKEDNYRPLDQAAVDALAASIKEVGLQEPIRLFEVVDTKELHVISGHHRLAALKKIKKDPRYAHKIFQAFILQGSQEDLKSQKTAIHSLISNVLRNDLALIDRAEAYHRLRERGASAQEIGRMVHKDKRTIEMTLNVALLPQEAKDFVRNAPRLRDSTVYRLAVKLKKDPNFDIMGQLKEAAAPRHQRQGASVQTNGFNFRANRPVIQERLEKTAHFSGSDIERILQVLESIYDSQRP